MRKLKKKKVIIKKDFCLKGLVIKLRESNVNRCENLKTSTCDI